MNRFITAVLVAAALAGAGCGKSSSSSSASGGSTTTTAAGPGGSTTTTAKGQTTTTAKGQTTTTAKGQTTTTAKGATTTSTTDYFAGPTTTVPVTAKLDRACVHPGEFQGLTTTGPPRGTVIYDTQYSDGTNGFTTRYSAGFGRGDADANGYFYANWSVPLNAPAGPAVVNVGMTNGRTFSQPRVPFTIKAVGVPC